MRIIGWQANEDISPNQSKITAGSALMIPHKISLVFKHRAHPKGKQIMAANFLQLLTLV
jgi:hypothetical protein